QSFHVGLWADRQEGDLRRSKRPVAPRSSQDALRKSAVADLAARYRRKTVGTDLLTLPSPEPALQPRSNVGAPKRERGPDHRKATGPPKARHVSCECVRGRTYAKAQQVGVTTVPISSLYLLGRAVGYRDRARKARELADKTPADAKRLSDLASSLEDKA